MCVCLSFCTEKNKGNRRIQRFNSDLREEYKEGEEENEEACLRSLCICMYIQILMGGEERIRKQNKTKIKP